jgi:feruloyl esterase
MRRTLLVVGIVFVGFVLGSVDGSAQTRESCERLRVLAMPNVQVTSADVVPAGPFTPPGAGAGAPIGAPLDRLPAFCRVAATLTPTPDSVIGTEVWLPLSGWNQKLQSVGNGAWAGSVPYPALGAALTAGYAVAGTDTGHVGNTASFVPGHPEKLVDYGSRAVHEMTVVAKAMIAAFYGAGPRLSYWNGCSTGGRQGLMEAQRYPADYDGIIAGAPVNDRVHQMIHELWVAQAVHASDASFIPASKYPLIHAAVLDRCDAHDGAKDGLLESPQRCQFDPAVLQCRAGDTSSCLTAPQVQAARQIYAPVVNPRTKALVFPGLQPGSELGWSGLAGPNPVGEAVEYFQYVVFNRPSWDFKTLNFDGDVALADAAGAAIINATDPNLKPFFDRGGKVLMYHGWNDQLVAPLNSVNYYGRVRESSGAGAAASIRLFMMPGVNHCARGDGPDTFDKMRVLEQWVEGGQAPSRITAEHRVNGAVDRTRPLCAYPQVAKYAGQGSLDDAANFVCEEPFR